MAAVHKGKRTLRGQAWHFLLGSVVWRILMVVGVWIVLHSAVLRLHAAVYFLPFLCLGGAVFYHRRYRIFRAGAVGEAAALSALRKLPRGYHVFTNFLMAEDGMCDEADFVVVGETGVFVIEVKHHGGRIVGRAEDTQWTQYRGKKGKAMRNPFSQTMRHAANLIRVLRSRGQAARVRAVLVFTNPRVRLEIGNGIPAVLRGGETIRTFILAGQPVLTADAVDAIASCLRAGG